MLARGNRGILWTGLIAVAACARGDGSEGDAGGLTTLPTATAGDGTSGDGTGADLPPSTTSATSGGTTATGTTTGGDTGGTPEEPPGTDTKFDLGVIPDAGQVCGNGGGGTEFSYIWIANSPQGTVSKIDTRNLVEEGRYVTGPPGAQDPSRTSVALGGDVAVVNRAGGISKIYATPSRCTDKNANGFIDTSTGPNDVLGWDVEECVAWNTQLPVNSRPAAWTAGEEAGVDDCGSPIYVNEKVWTSSPVDASSSIVYLIDGEDGTIENQVNVPAGGSYGIYGGAVDPVNDLWGVIWSAGPMVHVRFSDLTYEVIDLPNQSAYGFTIDSKGRAWVGGFSGVLQRYDPADQSWVTVAMPNINSLSRGMMEDQNGQLWIAALSQGILRIDTDSATFVELIDSAKLPGLGTPTGTSVDIDGLVWMVDQTKGGGGSWVYDPVAGSAEWLGGLVGPYTYSDMTGWALKNVANPSG